MKLQDAPRKAVEERNATACGRIADVLRFRYGMNYDQTVAVAESVAARPRCGNH